MSYAHHVVETLLSEDHSVLRGDPVYEKLDRDDKEEIDKRVAKALKSKDVKNSVREVAIDVLNDFVKTLYIKRGFWMNDVK